MATNEIAQRLRSLVDADGKRRHVEHQITICEKSLEQRASQFKSASQSYEATSGDFAQAKKRVDRLELDAKALRNAEADKKEKLTQATKGSVCEHLEHELDTILAKQEALEDDLVQAWHDLESRKKAADLIKTEQEELKATYEKESLEIEATCSGLRKELESLVGERDKQIVELTPEWQKRYAAMQLHVADPIVPVIQGLCSSCFYPIIPRDAAQLRKKEILECRSCYRLLYVEDEPEAPLAGATDEATAPEQTEDASAPQ